MTEMTTYGIVPRHASVDKILSLGQSLVRDLGVVLLLVRPQGIGQRVRHELGFVLQLPVRAIITPLRQVSHCQTTRDMDGDRTYTPRTRVLRLKFPRP